MIRVNEPPHDDRAAAPTVDRNEAGPWHRLEQDAFQYASFARLLAVNIPLRLLRHSHECGGDGATLVGRLVRGATDADDDDRNGAREADARQAHAASALLSLLADASGACAQGKARKARPVGASFGGQRCLHTCPNWRRAVGGCATYLPAFVWCLEAVVAPKARKEGDGEGKGDGVAKGAPKQAAATPPPGRGLVVGVRIWKHVLDPYYSDSLSVDAQRAHAADLHAKAGLAGGAPQKRARDALRDAATVPAKAHLRVGRLVQLLHVYKAYGTAATPLVRDWERHFAKVEHGSDPLACALGARPSERHLHALAPELLLNPGLNPRALSAGLAMDEEAAAASAPTTRMLLPAAQLDARQYGASPVRVPSVVSDGRLVWMLDVGESPLSAVLPPELSSQLDASLERAWPTEQPRGRRAAKVARTSGAPSK